jgi:hypothetical protein
MDYKHHHLWNKRVGGNEILQMVVEGKDMEVGEEEIHFQQLEKSFHRDTHL